MSDPLTPEQIVEWREAVAAYDHEQGREDAFWQRVYANGLGPTEREEGQTESYLYAGEMLRLLAIEHRHAILAALADTAAKEVEL